MSEEDVLKAYLKEEFSRIDRRLSQIEGEISQLPKFLDAYGKAMAKSSKSFDKAMDKFLDAVRVFDRESKARAKEASDTAKILKEHFKTVLTAIQNWNENLKKQTKMLSGTLKKLEEMADEEKYED